MISILTLVDSTKINIKTNSIKAIWMISVSITKLLKTGMLKEESRASVEGQISRLSTMGNPSTKSEVGEAKTFINLEKSQWREDVREKLPGIRIKP